MGYFTVAAERRELKERVRLGIQCPECYGVRTDKRPEASKFQCLECGCQWDRNYYPAEE